MSKGKERHQEITESMHVVFMGHVDHGKSTLAGRLLYELGLVSDKMIQDYKEEAEHLGKPTFEFAWVMDRVKESRERGLTIEVSYRKFEVDKRRIIIVDGPGHPDFAKNLILGISEADAGVLIVAADDGIMPNTKEHAILARAFGIDQLILVVTKMDKRGIDYRKEVFDDLHEALRKMLTQIGFSEQKVVYVPASGYLGENVTRPSPKMQWHDGPTFLNTFLLLKPAMRSLELPFRMPIDQVLSKGGIGTIATGKVATGMIHRGHKVIVQPEGIVTTIKSIQEFKVDISYAAAGDDIGVALRGIKRKAIRRGSVLGNPMAPPMVGKKLLAKVLIMNHPSRIRVQYTPTLFVHSKYCPARITRLVSTIDPLTERVLEREPDFMKSGDTGYMELSLQEPIVIEHSSEFPRLSKFVMRDQNATVGVGTCVEIIPIS